MVSRKIQSFHKTKLTQILKLRLVVDFEVETGKFELLFEKK